MTKQEFLKYVQDHTKPSYYEKKLYRREDFTDSINDSRRNDSSPQKIIDFFDGMGLTMFDRVERKSGDVLTINIFYYFGTHYWNDIGCMVGYCGWISNCSVYEIESFYISEQGKFYNQDHKLIAENEEVFLIILQRLSTTSTPKYRSEHIIYCVILVGMRADILTRPSLNIK